MQAMLQEM
jgi:predicted nuclease with TOPRIM domain